MISLRKLGISLLASAVAGGVGAIVTMPAIPNWYASLDKPVFNPPSWVFGPVWTVLYVLIGLSLYWVWSARSKRSKRAALGMFALQLVLNAAWSVVFFGLHQIAASVVVIVLLLLAIAATMYLFWPISKRAAYALLPYLLWVGFAAGLNIAIMGLNGPTGPIRSYDDCAQSGGVILESYPSICLSKNKKRFVNPAEQVQVSTDDMLLVSQWALKLPLGQGVTDASYTYDSQQDRIYLTTPTLEQLVARLGSCRSGMHGLFFKLQGGKLREQGLIEPACAVPVSEDVDAIQQLQIKLRAAADQAQR